MFRKMMLTAAVAILVLPAMASAQSEVRATGTVAPTAVVGGSGDLDFGTLTDAGVVINAAGAGAAQRTVTFNHDIDVSFDNVPAVLTGASATLPVQLMCASQLGGTWSTPVDCLGATLQLNVGSALTVATLGFGGIILGADVALVPAGEYSATFDIVVEAR